MIIKETPLGIWVISGLLLAGASAISYFSVDSGRFGLVTAISFGLSAAFIVGLMLRVKWLYFAFLLFLSFGIFLQLVAALLILSALIAGGDIDWLRLVARYWQGALVMMVICGTIFYLSRGSVREHFFPRQHIN